MIQRDGQFLVMYILSIIITSLTRFARLPVYLASAIFIHIYPYHWLYNGRFALLPLPGLKSSANCSLLVPILAKGSRAGSRGHEHGYHHGVKGRPGDRRGEGLSLYLVTNMEWLASSMDKRWLANRGRIRTWWFQIGIGSIGDQNVEGGWSQWGVKSP